MSAAALPLKLELRKQRRGRIILSTVGILGLWLVWTLFLIQARAAKSGQFAATDFALRDGMGMSWLFSPLFVAVIAARLAAVDHQERMGQVFDALGQSLRQRFVAKLLILNAWQPVLCAARRGRGWFRRRHRDAVQSGTARDGGPLPGRAPAGVRRRRCRAAGAGHAIPRPSHRADRQRGRGIPDNGT